MKDLFVGKFNKSILSYAEVLNDASQFNLNHKISEVSRFLESKREELEQVDRTGKISPDIINCTASSLACLVSQSLRNMVELVFFTLKLPDFMKSLAVSYL